MFRKLIHAAVVIGALGLPGFAQADCVLAPSPANAAYCDSGLERCVFVTPSPVNKEAACAGQDESGRDGMRSSGSHNLPAGPVGFLFHDQDARTGDTAEASTSAGAYSGLVWASLLADASYDGAEPAGSGDLMIWIDRRCNRLQFASDGTPTLTPC